MEPVNSVTNEQVLQNLNPSDGKKKWFLVLLAVILLLFAGFGGFYLVQMMTPASIIQEEVVTSATPSPVLPLGDGDLSLMSTNNKVSVGVKIPVEAQLTTNGRIISRAEINVKYDHKLLDIDTTNPFTNGKVFLKDPVVSKDLVKGILRITGDLGEAGKGFNGIGVLGTVNFVARAEGLSMLSVKDSLLTNLLSQRNILGKAYGLEVTVIK